MSSRLQNLQDQMWKGLLRSTSSKTKEERRYACRHPGCKNAVYTRMQALDAHIISQHSGEPTPYRCTRPDCGRRFRRSYDRDRHEREDHDGKRSFACGGECGSISCRQTFKRKFLLNRHTKRHRKPRSPTQQIEHPLAGTCAASTVTSHAVCEDRIVVSEHLNNELVREDVSMDRPIYEIDALDEVLSAMGAWTCRDIHEPKTLQDDSDSSGVSTACHRCRGARCLCADFPKDQEFDFSAISLDERRSLSPWNYHGIMGTWRFQVPWPVVTMQGAIDGILEAVRATVEGLMAHDIDIDLEIFYAKLAKKVRKIEYDGRTDLAAKVKVIVLRGLNDSRRKGIKQRDEREAHIKEALWQEYQEYRRLMSEGSADAAGRLSRATYWVAIDSSKDEEEQTAAALQQIVGGGGILTTMRLNKIVSQEYLDKKRLTMQWLEGTLNALIALREFTPTISSGHTNSTSEWVVDPVSRNQLKPKPSVDRALVQVC